MSNSDNLGAVLDPRILAWFAAEGLPFAMEVADRTEADRKGGHIARRREGGLVLREVAQTADEDLDAFQDVERHRFFNTNNLWLDLEVLARVMDERGGVLGLPMIVNRKTVDPTDKSSTPVIQLETAMGAAIDVFDGAQALRVPRSRFIPVKTTNDLLVLRSDAYELRGDGRVALAAQRDGAAPLVDLGSPPAPPRSPRATASRSAATCASAEASHAGGRSPWSSAGGTLSRSRTARFSRVSLGSWPRRRSARRARPRGRSPRARARTARPARCP